MRFSVLPRQFFRSTIPVDEATFHQLKNDKFNIPVILHQPYKSPNRGVAKDDPTISYIWNEDHFEIIKSYYNSRNTIEYQVLGHGVFKNDGKIIEVIYTIHYNKMFLINSTLWLAGISLLIFSVYNDFRSHTFFHNDSHYGYAALTLLIPFIINMILKGQFEILHKQLMAE